MGLRLSLPQQKGFLEQIYAEADYCIIGFPPPQPPFVVGVPSCTFVDWWALYWPHFSPTYPPHLFRRRVRVSVGYSSPHFDPSDPLRIRIPLTLGHYGDFLQVLSSTLCPPRKPQPVRRGSGWKDDADVEIHDNDSIHEFGGGCRAEFVHEGFGPSQALELGRIVGLENASWKDEEIYRTSFLCETWKFLN